MWGLLSIPLFQKSMSIESGIYGNRFWHMGVLEVNKIWGKGSGEGWDFGRQEGVRNQMVTEPIFRYCIYVCVKSEIPR